MALVNVVTNATPFQFTTDPATKFVPVTFKEKPAAPAIAVVCDSERSVGAGLLIVNVMPVEVPPPGAGFVTVTDAVPAVAKSASGTTAVKDVALTNVVVSGVPFQFTTDVPTKFVPVIVSVDPAAPAVTDVCESDVRVGAGLLIAKEIPPEVPPPGAAFTTVTFAVPAVVRSPTGTAAVICVALTNVVTKATPFQSTTEVGTKLVPVRVNVNAASPAVADVCESEIRVGSGLLIVNVSAFEVAPEGMMGPAG